MFLSLRSSILYLILALGVLSLCISQTIVPICHYTCLTCNSSQYYSCVTCQPNRGLLLPFGGMCYCRQNFDQDQNGNCLETDLFNYNNKTIVWVFVAFTLLFTFCMMVIRGVRYYFIKLVQDIQEVAIVVFINLYFPQQFDVFNTILYRFNMSSYTFQAITAGSLFSFDQNNGIVSTDGSNIYGKYKLLYKTANFFSNQFTWMIGALIILIVMGVFKFLKNKMIENSNKQTIEQDKASQNLSYAQINQTQQNFQGTSQLNACKVKKLRIKKQSRDYSSYSLDNLILRLHNILWLNFPITFFYFSLIQININIFSQILNLKIGSGFAGAGIFFAVLFIILQLVALIFLAIKTYKQLIKPQWMRDSTYSACFYLLRTNFKMLTKYFFFISCLKKIMLACMVVVFYNQPKSAILAISLVQLIYLIIAMYCEPYQKRHIRIHFFLSQMMKLFYYISLINFVEQYKELSKLIDITNILFFMLTCLFGFHFVVVIITLIIQRNVYLYELKIIVKRMRKWCSKTQAAQSIQAKQSIQETQNAQVIGYVHWSFGSQIKSQKQKSVNIQQKQIDIQKMQIKQDEKQDTLQQRKYFYIYTESTQQQN